MLLGRQNFRELVCYLSVCRHVLDVERFVAYHFVANGENCCFDVFRFGVKTMVLEPLDAGFVVVPDHCWWVHFTLLSVGHVIVF